MSEMTEERLAEIESHNFLWDEHRDYELLAFYGLELLDEVRRLRAEIERYHVTLGRIERWDSGQCGDWAHEALNPEATQ